jgi:RNA polymerase sigma factor (sigma-70 family)
VALLQGNSEAGYSYLYDHYSASLYGAILRIVADRDAANDLLQDTFVKVWKNRDKYQPSKGRLYTWMLNICRNTCIDYLRLAENKREIQNIEDSVYTVDKQYNTKEEVDETGLQEIINRLKPERKQLLDMAYFEGYTQEEIAERLNIPLGTVKTRIRAALQELRTYFTLLFMIIMLKIL